jgi:hypothetical protein
MARLGGVGPICPGRRVDVKVGAGNVCVSNGAQHGCQLSTLVLADHARPNSAHVKYQPFTNSASVKTARQIQITRPETRKNLLRSRPSARTG